jgi:hypothetical protein
MDTYGIVEESSTVSDSAVEGWEWLHLRPGRDIPWARVASDRWTGTWLWDSA